MRRSGRFVATAMLTLALWVSGCGGGAGGDGPAAATPGSATIAAAGGTVDGPDGVQVVVPADAFAEALTVRIARDSTGAPPLPDTLKAAGPVYAITPHGGDFRRHVEVTIPLPDTPLADNEQRVLVTAEPGDTRWTVLASATPVGQALRVPVMQFSYFQIVTLADLRTPTVTLIVNRLASVPVPGTTQVTADHAVTYGTGDWPEFSFEARVTPPANPLSLASRPLTTAPRLCVPSDLGPAGGRIVVRRDGAVMPVGIGHHASGAAQLSTWPRNRLEAAPQGFLDTARTDLWSAGPGVAHFWGQDQPRAGAVVELRRATMVVPPNGSALLIDRYTLPPAGNLAYDDDLNWYGTLGLGIEHNGRIRIDAGVATDCGFDVAAVPLAFRLEIIEGAAQQYYPGVQPVLAEGDLSPGTAPTQVTVSIGQDVSLAFWNLALGNVWNLPEDRQVGPLQSVDSIAWEFSSDGVVWRAAPELAPWVSVYTDYVDSNLGEDGGTAHHNVLRSWAIRFPAAGPGRTGYYRASACVHLAFADGRTVGNAMCQPSRAYRLEVVSNPPTLTRQPLGQTVLVGETASLSVTVQGSPPADLQWQTRSFADAFLNRPWTNIPGATAASYTTLPLTLADHPTLFRVAYSNASGGGFSDVAMVSVVAQLAPPSILAQPGSLNVTVGATAVFAASADGAAPLSYQWRRSGVAIVGANAPILTLANVTAADDGRYDLVVTNRAGSATSEPAALVVTLGTPVALAPTIARPPTSLTVPTGSAANFATAVTGTGPYSYAWMREGQAQPVGTDPILAFAAVQPGDAGRYQVRVTNNVGTVLSAYAELNVGPASETPVAPAIVTPPVAVAVLPGTQAVFAVGASGSGPLAFQWRRNGIDIAGANSAVLAIAAATGNDAGTYSVEVRNAMGAVTSAPVPLVIIGAPTITTPPAAASVTNGSSAFFSVAASGDALRYQWTRDNIAIAGATSASYTTPALTLGDSGRVYGVIVYNGAGMQFSSGAVLTVSSGATPGMVILAGDFTAGGGGGSADGNGTSARFDFPEGIAADAAGNLYVATSNGGRVRKIDPSANVTTLALQAGAANVALAGNGDLYSATVSYCGLMRIAPPLAAGATTETITVASCPGQETRGAAVGPDGLAYLALRDAHTIVRVRPGSPFASVEVVAGAADTFNGSGSQDGSGAAARFSSPRGIAFDPDGNLYVADSGNHTIRRITPAGVVSTFAGSAGNHGLADAIGSEARFFTPTDLAFDAAGNLIVLQRGDPANPQAHVRRITPAGAVTTLFDATAEAQALAAPGQASIAAVIRGIAVRSDGRIALAAGQAILLRTLP